MLSRKRQAELKEKHDALPYPKANVQRISEDKLKINDHQFELKVNYHDGFDSYALSERYTELFDQYDFIVGDWSFEQLRLKGFYYDEAHTGQKDQEIKHLPDYILEYCSFGCAYFVLEHKRSEAEIKNRDNQVTQEYRDIQKSSRKKRRKNNNRSHRRKNTAKKAKPKHAKINKEFTIIDKKGRGKQSNNQRKKTKKPTTFEIR